MDPFIYRECRATITARIPDTPDADAHPDRVLVQGRGTAHPQFQGGSVVFTEIGEYAIPQPIPVVIVDGELLVEVLAGDESVETQPLFLPVTVDERANQNWSWRLTFDFLTLGEYGEEVKHPPLSFPVEAGDGPLEISTVATPVIKSQGFVTRGAPGRGITSITADGGVVTVEWEGGDDVQIPIPTAALATVDNDGLMPRTAVPVVEQLGTYLAPASISSSTHLDTITLPGRSRTISSTIAGNPALGYPEGAVHGTLTVERITTNDPPYIIQTWLDSWNFWTARRRLYQGSWSDWTKDPNAAALTAAVSPLDARLTALEDSRPVPSVQGARTMHVTGDYRPDAFMAPEGTVSYWTGPSGVERIPWAYRGDGYVGRIGTAAGYSLMQVKKVEASNEVEVSCLNPSTGRHITHRVQGPTSTTDDQRRFEEAWVGTYTGTTVSKDLLILPRSNIEWAFQLDVDGNRQFAPYHGSNSAKAWQYEPAVITDATGATLDLDSMAVDDVLTGVLGFKVRQRLYLTHPDSGDTRWAAVDEVRTIAPDGMIQSESVITFLRDTTIGNNYGPMTPVAAGTFDQLTVLDGGAYAIPTTPPSSTQYLEIDERHDGVSALFTSTTEPSAFVACAILDPDATYRRGDPMEETGATSLRLELRANGLVKLYPVAFASGSVIPAGTVWRIGAQWRYGETTNPLQYA